MGRMVSKTVGIVNSCHNIGANHVQDQYEFAVT